MDVLKCYEQNKKHSFKILISLYKGTYTTKYDSFFWYNS